ncbi:hypothetical protein NHX12_011634, partial [Muraenolepis orangiensis]
VPPNPPLPGWCPRHYPPLPGRCPATTRLSPGGVPATTRLSPGGVPPQPVPSLVLCVTAEEEHRQRKRWLSTEEEYVINWKLPCTRHLRPECITPTLARAEEESPANLLRGGSGSMGPDRSSQSSRYVVLPSGDKPGVREGQQESDEGRSKEPLRHKEDTSLGEVVLPIPAYIGNMRPKVDENWNYTPALCRALQDFHPKETSDLEDWKHCLGFLKADILTVIRRVDGHWIEAKLGERVGVVPLQFVEPNSVAAKLLEGKSRKGSDSAEFPNRIWIAGNADKGPAAPPPPNRTGPLGALQVTLPKALKVNVPPLASKGRQPSISYALYQSGRREAASGRNPAGYQGDVVLHHPTSAATQGAVASAKGTTQQVRRRSDTSHRHLPQGENKMNSETPPTITMALAGPQVASSSAEVKNASTQQLSISVCAALYSYTPRRPEELELRKGEMVGVYGRFNEGWLRGLSLRTSKVGILPANYVTPVLRTSARLMEAKAAPAAASYNTFTAGKRPTVSNNPAVILALDRVNADGTVYAMGQGPSVPNGTQHATPSNAAAVAGRLSGVSQGQTGVTPLEVWAPSLTLGRDGPGIILKEGKAPVLRKGLESSQISDLNSNPQKQVASQPMQSVASAQFSPTRHRVVTTYLAQEDSELSLLQGERVLVHRPRPDGRLLSHKSEKPEISDNVKVVVRCRPLNQKERTMGHKQAVSVDEIRGTITVNKLETQHEPPKTFTFDTVFGQESKQLDVYNLTARPIVDSVLEGYNGTIFAYGQTGTGKTFTMEGVRAVPELRGIIPNSFAHVFGHIAKAEGDTRFLVRVSYLEIYNEEVRDLLGKDQLQRLEVKERPDVGVYIKDLSGYVVNNADDMDRIMTLGHKNRSVGATNMNEHSSRSHAIFTITIECSEKGVDGNQHVRMGKLHLVDLAGSERQGKTGATGQRLKEATKINLSLSTLGNVISALVDGKSTHVPYRNSKLTRLLQDSLGGNSKTMMCANIGPADYNYDETISTLRYANRAKNIKNKARINEDPKDALLRQFQKEIEDLKKKLEEGEEISGSEASGSEELDDGNEEGGEAGEGRRRKR